MDRATSQARGQCGHMVQCGAHNETVRKIGKNIQNGPRRKTSCNPGNPGPLKTRLSCRADFGADRMDQAAFQCPCHHAHICNRSRACRPLHKSALYRVFAGFSVNNLIAWVSVGSNTVTVRARKLGGGGWEYTFATATCTRTKTVHVHNGKGASNPQLSNQAHKYSRRSAWIMIHVVVAPTFSQNMHIFVLKNWSSYRLHETPSLVSFPFFHIFSILVMFVKFSFIASLFR